MIDLFKFFFLKKADKKDLLKILDKEGFVYKEEDVLNLLKGNQKGVRYGNAVFLRNEKGVQIERFFKVLLDGKLKNFKLFRRQVEITKVLNIDPVLGSSSIKLIKSSLDSRVSYAIFETREDGEGFGFMHDKPLFYEKFSEQDMEKLVNSIYSFHQSGENISNDVWRHTQHMSSDLNFYKKEAKKLLNEIVSHKLLDGTIKKDKVKNIIEKYFGINGVEQKVLNIFDRNWKFVTGSKSKTRKYLVHADMQIDNLYKHKNGDFELIDFEWVGGSDNPVVAIMYDYGNLRARAWSSLEFQNLLDRKMLEVGGSYYKDIDFIKSGVVLGTLRSSVVMARFHLDFFNTVKKDKRTEDDYRNMYKKTLESLKNIIENNYY